MEFQKQGGKYIGEAREQADGEEQTLGEEEEAKGSEDEPSGDEVDEVGEGKTKQRRRRTPASTPAGHQGHSGTRSNGGRKSPTPK